MNARQRLLETIDDWVRHRNLLGEHRWLRNVLRRRYHRFINSGGCGVPLMLGGHIPVRVPAEFCSKLMEGYEVDEFKRIKDWLSLHPGGLFVDIGCSLGYISCAALFCSKQVRVIAIDSDLSSLRSTERVCSLIPKGRLWIIWGMLTAEAEKPKSWCEVNQDTLATLQRRPDISGDPECHEYRYLDCADSVGIPRHALDSLLSLEIKRGQALLVKCDVEGAEYEVLRGAQQVLRVLRPDVLLSVHPLQLSKRGVSMEMVACELDAHNYQVEEYAVDHEHHWHCRPHG